MSSLDRAFFRAYAKEQTDGTAPEAPAEAASAAPAAESPYVHFQSQRKPQLRYRIEPTHAPWGQGAAPPHVDVAPIQTPYEEGDYRLALPAEEPTPPPAWSHAGEGQLLLTPAVSHADAIPAATPNKPLDAVDLFAAGIVCLPGMAALESDYLAAFVAEELIGSEPDVPSPAPVADMNESLPLVDEVPESLPEESSPQAQQAANDDATVEIEATQETAPEPAEQTAVAEATLAFWEVDRFLYPSLSDRLLSRYDYFAHAGDKLKQAAASGLKVLGITGVGRDEGRSTLAICLARAAARSNLKVVLIDCDFSRPCLAEQIGLDVTSGWQSVATGELTLAEVAIRSLEDGVTLLPLTENSLTSSLTLNDERVARVLSQAGQSHDVVILDVGPQGEETAEPSTIGAALDAAIVVWDRRRRTLDEAQAVAQALNTAGVEAVGIAENFAS